MHPRPGFGAPGAGQDEPVAVIGAACRFPGGVSSPLTVAAAHGAQGHGPGGPRERWDQAELAGLPDQVADRLRHGCFLDDDIHAYEPGFFGINAQEAPWVDPEHRLLSEVAREAVEHAGIPARAPVRHTDGHVLRPLPEGLHAACAAHGPDPSAPGATPTGAHLAGRTGVAGIMTPSPAPPPLSPPGALSGPSGDHRNSARASLVPQQAVRTAREILIAGHAAAPGNYAADWPA